MTREEKLKKAEELRIQINKDMGKGSVMLLSEKPDRDVETVSTGSIGLNIALGVGGLPYGRVVEIYGPESSGKTTLAIHTIAEAQKLGGFCAIIDAEHAFDKGYAAKIGVDIDNLIIAQPDYGEQGLEIADKLISSGIYSVIVIDSVAALVPKAELEGEMGDSKMGLQARLMGQALRKLTAKVQKTGTLLIFINQLREKIGVMFGSPETTSGGNALKFYASVRLDVRKVTTNKDGDVAISNKTRVKVIKNKVAPPFRMAEFDIEFGVGIDKLGEILDIGSALGIITKAGAHYSYNDAKIAYGRDKAYAFLQDNPELADEIEKLIMQNLKG